MSRRNHGSAQIGNSLVIYGGQNQKGMTLKDLNIYNCEANRWVKPSLSKDSDYKRTKPGRLHSFQMTAYYHPNALRTYGFDWFAVPKQKTVDLNNHYNPTNSGIWIFGGIDESGEFKNKLILMQPKLIEGTFHAIKFQRVKAIGKPPTPRANHGQLLLKTHLVIFGGRGPNNSTFALNDLNIFDLTSFHWARCVNSGEVPCPRWSHAMATIGTKILIFGGLQLKRFCSADLYVAEIEQINVI